MKPEVTTVVLNDWQPSALHRSLDSLAAQSQRPDRVIILSYGDPDSAAKEPALPLPCERQTLPADARLFDACNAALPFAAETQFLHLLQAGDVLQPQFLSTLAAALGTESAFALAYCQEETLDEHGRRVKVAGWRRSGTTVLTRDRYLRGKAGLQPQPMSGTLLRTHRQRLPCRFRVELSRTSDVAFWASFGVHCEKIIHVHQPLCARRWEPLPAGPLLLPGVQALVYDEFRVMQNAERLRGRRPGWLEEHRLKWILTRRAALKARRAGQLEKGAHAEAIGHACQRLTGWWRWVPATAWVHARDLLLYGVLRRRQAPFDLNA